MKKLLIYLFLLIFTFAHSQDKYGKFELKTKDLFSKDCIVDIKGDTNYTYKIKKNKYISRINDKTGRWKIEKKGYVDFKQSEFEMELEFKENGIKETTKVTSGNRIIYDFNTNIAQPVFDDYGNIYWGKEFYTPKPHGWYYLKGDTNKQIIEVTTYLSLNKIILEFDNEGNYPVYIDPTIENVSSKNTGRIYVLGTYANARGLSSGTNTTTAIVGMSPYGGDHYIQRLFLKLPVQSFSTDTINVDSVLIALYGSDNQSSEDFDYGAYVSNFGDLEGGDFDNFDGWQSGVTPYTTTALSGTRSSSSYIGNYGNTLKLNSAGIDSVIAHSGDSLQCIILSSEDINANAPSADEYMQFEGTGDSNPPKLIIYYTVISQNPDPPSGLTSLATDTNQINIVSTSPSGIGVKKMFAEIFSPISSVFIDSASGGIGADTSFAYDFNNVVFDTGKGITPNSEVVYGIGFDSLGFTSDILKDTIYTFAQIPDTLVYSDFGIDSLTLNLFSDNNSNDTKYCIYDSTRNKFIGTDGIVHSDSQWILKSEFPIVVLGLDPALTYRLKVRASNGDSVRTVWSNYNVMDATPYLHSLQRTYVLQVDTANTKDTWVWSLDPTSSFGSADTLTLRNNIGTGYGWIKWDDLSVGSRNIFENDTIIDIINTTITFKVKGFNAGASSGAYLIDKATDTDWSESATWNDVNTEPFANAKSFDFNSSTVTIECVSDSLCFWINDWIRKRYDNLGFALKGSISTLLYSFYSSDYIDTTQAPKLEFEALIPGEKRLSQVPSSPTVTVIDTNTFRVIDTGGSGDIQIELQDNIGTYFDSLGNSYNDTIGTKANSFDILVDSLAYNMGYGAKFRARFDSLGIVSEWSDWSIKKYTKVKPIPEPKFSDVDSNSFQLDTIYFNVPQESLYVYLDFNVDGHDHNESIESDTIVNDVWAVNKIDSFVVGYGSFNFGGSEDYISYSAMESMSVFTITFWTKISGGDGTERFIFNSEGGGANKGIMIELETDNTFELNTGGDNAANKINSPSVYSSDSGWVFVAVRHDGTNASIFINGDSVVSESQTEADAGFFDAPTIGAKTNAGASSWNGYIDDFRIYKDKALNSDEITQIYKFTTDNQFYPDSTLISIKEITSNRWLQTDSIFAGSEFIDNIKTGWESDILVTGLQGAFPYRISYKTYTPDSTVFNSGFSDTTLIWTYPAEPNILELGKVDSNAFWVKIDTIDNNSDSAYYFIKEITTNDYINFSTNEFGSIDSTRKAYLQDSIRILNLTFNTFYDIKSFVKNGENVADSSAGTRVLTLAGIPLPSGSCNGKEPLFESIDVCIISDNPDYTETAVYVTAISSGWLNEFGNLQQDTAWFAWGDSIVNYDSLETDSTYKFNGIARNQGFIVTQLSDTVSVTTSFDSGAEFQILNDTSIGITWGERVNTAYYAVVQSSDSSKVTGNVENPGDTINLSYHEFFNYKILRVRNDSTYSYSSDIVSGWTNSALIDSIGFENVGGKKLDLLMYHNFKNDSIPKFSIFDSIRSKYITTDGDTSTSEIFINYNGDSSQTLTVINLDTITRYYFKTRNKSNDDSLTVWSGYYSDSTFVGLKSPINFDITSIGVSTFVGNWTNTNFISQVTGYFIAYRSDSSAVADTILGFVSADTISRTLFLPNTKDTMIVAVFNDAGEIEYSDSDTTYSQPSKPTIWNPPSQYITAWHGVEDSTFVYKRTDSTIWLRLLPAGNPSYTKYRIFDTLRQSYGLDFYIDSSGSFTNDSVFYDTTAFYGSQGFLLNVLPGVQYQFKLEVKTGK